jgi:hypothetical protein
MVAASDQSSSRQISGVPLVSFIVPTLNRGRYVVRAVESCLRAEAGRTGVAVEVVVIDSQSDDGSWELLVERFGSDPRVRLVQNQRGIGPTRSWLDGAKLVKGEFVTFVWSDDYILPRFLRILLPLLQDGSELAVGSGAVREFDEDGDLLVDLVQKDVDREVFLVGYFSGSKHRIRRPMSPTCAIFKRPCLDKWVQIVEVWCNSTSFHQQVMWQRAIGPDLLLYLIAANMSSKVPTVFEDVAQFSAHKGSITISSSKWLLQAGYWCARLWLIECGIEEQPVSSKVCAEMAASALINGLRLAITIPKVLSGMGSVGETKRTVLVETLKLWRTVRIRAAVPAVIFAILVLVVRVFISRARSIYKT